MALAQLIYVSRRNKAVTIDEIHSIVEASKTNNALRNITGMLLCHGYNLMQILEGELSQIVPLFEKIRQDRRHSEVRCLLCKNINKRMFPEWGMALANLDSNAVVDHDRLAGLVEEIRLTTDTSHFSVEARILLNDFQHQFSAAP
ncbi:MAG TPA: BLUF domain-containing protein [Tepidisphaeraceae bacterium]|nr:BLUF domain-containing protein [Tepidisphaeraceae bacterium]